MVVIMKNNEFKQSKLSLQKWKIQWKDVYIGAQKNDVLGINVRVSILGGERHSPIDYNKSISSQQVIFDETKSYTKQYPKSSNVDLTVTYRINKEKHSSVWALQVKNVLGSPNREGYEYNYKTDKIEALEMPIVIPVISYKVEF